jgi:hypothetical protein
MLLDMRVPLTIEEYRMTVAATIGVTNDLEDDYQDRPLRSAAQWAARFLTQP